LSDVRIVGNFLRHKTFRCARGQSPAARHDAGNRPLSHYAQAWLDKRAPDDKPHVLADYQANYARYVEKPLGDKAVAAITAAEVRAFRLAPHPCPLGDLRHRQSITGHRHHGLIPLLGHATVKNQPKPKRQASADVIQMGWCAVRVSNPGPAD
jgi:hypothetical protein